MSFSSITRSLFVALALTLAAPAFAQEVAPAPAQPAAEDMQAALQELAGMGLRCATMYQQLAVSADDGSLQAAGFQAPQAAAYTGQKDFWHTFLLFLTNSDSAELDSVISQGTATFAEFIDGLGDPELEGRDELRLQLTGFMNQCSQVRASVVEPLLASSQPALQP